MNARQKVKKLKKEITKLESKIANIGSDYIRFPDPNLYELEREKKMYECLCKYMMMTGIGPRSRIMIDKRMLLEAGERELQIAEIYEYDAIKVRLL